MLTHPESVQASAMRARGRIGLVLKGYPRISETFIAQEILELERAGFDIEIISLRHPYDGATHPVHAEIKARVKYLPEYLHDEPWRVLKAWLKAHLMPGYFAAWRQFLSDFRRDRTRNRIRRFGQAMVMATEYSSELAFFYVHYLHTPCSATRYCATMTGQKFAISAHAKDIWTSPDWEVHEKLDQAEWLTTCTKGGAVHLQGLSPDPAKVHLIYHGLDLSRFPPPPARKPRNASDPVRLISVGRAVAKKGFDTVLDALASLPREVDWRWTHIGGGELRNALIGQAKKLGIEDRCDFRGALPQQEVIEAYRSSDVFILPCRIAESGDRDGLPNVIVEAQSQRLPVVSTPISGIPELIVDGENGLLVPPDEPNALANAILTLTNDPKTAARYGKEGEAVVRSKFDTTKTTGDLVVLLEATLENSLKEGTGNG